MLRIGLTMLLAMPCISSLFSQEAGGLTSLPLKITAAEIPRLKTQYLLLPAASQLRDGNAAVVMLRMIEVTDTR